MGEACRPILSCLRYRIKGLWLCLRDCSILPTMVPLSSESARDVILDSINDGVFTVDDQWRITSFNRAAERITGVTRDEAIGKPCCEVFRANICENACALKQTLATGRPVVNKAVYILDSKGNRIPISLSRRCEKRFVAVNCGAMPDTLLESELFGYKAGAFTDARHDKPGRFALADGGTIFLDEIGDISAAMQARLLRVLQERVFEPLGAVDPVKVDVRVIAATNKNVARLVRKGMFREDLFYRINVIRLILPRLRDRREDIPLFIQHFISKFNRLQGKDVVDVSDEVLALLMEYDYPGNVRELEHIIEHAFVLCQSGLIQLEHLPPHVRRAARGRSIPDLGGMTLSAMEKVLITDALRRHAGNRKAAARQLGINPSTLFRKAKALGIELPAIDGRHKARQRGDS